MSAATDDEARARVSATAVRVRRFMGADTLQWVTGKMVCNGVTITDSADPANRAEQTV
uniref:Uncharacterized protein n=1 Tax=Marinobacter nauticus TaxID=2743 RepID=A0A455W965_MARNT|nr:hypothetical protein YBY_36690 [Marinobacter nauticus]